MDKNAKGALRLPIIFAVLMALALAASAGVWVQKQSDDGLTKIETKLLNHNQNDDKDNCPNDGNAGRGDDNKGPNGGCKEHPPRGQYGQACREKDRPGNPNPNDDKDNCPNDGNAGGGNDG